ncbi:hypothetical protein FQA47_007673 [Oryzias melastigma]|uniref:Uncharacterized protein n=1 Tax=Oryzias melastigma TaxID=30732 RepID=A0A834C682_ORYME|nr:hypothetical protein FQA47_007673 [Oryzias melastigma]
MLNQGVSVPLLSPAGVYLPCCSLPRQITAWVLCSLLRDPRGQTVRLWSLCSECERQNLEKESRRISIRLSFEDGISEGLFAGFQLGVLKTKESFLPTTGRLLRRACHSL